MMDYTNDEADTIEVQIKAPNARHGNRGVEGPDAGEAKRSMTIGVDDPAQRIDRINVRGPIISS
jgi:hypothetical protein